MATRGLAVILAENIYEDLELHYPRLRLVEAGFDVKVAGPKAGESYASKHGYPVQADVSFEAVDPRSVRILVVPGGYAPDKLRRYPACNKLVADVHAAGGAIGFICHAGWVPISAKILKGKRVTAHFSIRDDLENAGAIWVDQPCVVDGNLVSAQVPKDLPEFMQALLKLTT